MVDHESDTKCAAVSPRPAARLRRAGAPRGGPLGSAAAMLLAIGVFGAAIAGGDDALASLALEPGTTGALHTLPAAVAAAAEEGLSCGAVSTCADKCAAQCPSGIRKLSCLIGCKDDCRDKGCASAKTRFDELTDCVASSCWTSCMSGPTADCRECTQKDCASEAKRCTDHACGT